MIKSDKNVTKITTSLLSRNGLRKDYSNSLNF